MQTYSHFSHGLQAMEKAIKEKRLKEDNKLRQQSLDAAISQQEESLRQVQRLITERKDAAKQLRELQEQMKKTRIEECQREAEVLASRSSLNQSHVAKEHKKHTAEVMETREAERKREHEERAKRLAEEEVCIS
jgi:hypothetical protein